MDKNQSSPSFINKRNSQHPDSLGIGYTTYPEISDEDKVYKELSKIFAAARRRSLLIIGVAVSVSATVGFLLSKRPPMYEGKFQLLVEPVTTSESKLLSLITETEGDRRAIINGKDFTLDYESQIRVLSSPKIMYPIVDRIKEKYKNITYESLMNNLLIERPIKESVGTRILEVSYKDKDPDKIQFVLNLVAQDYLKYSLEDRQTNISKGIKFIEEQIPQLQNRVDQIQGQIQKLRQKYNLIDSKNQAELLAKQAYNISSQKLENQAKLAESRSLYAAQQKMLAEDKVSAILIREPFGYTQLLKQIQELDGTIALKAAQFREDSQLMRALQKQRQELTAASRKEAQRIQEKLQAEIVSLEDREEAINKAENAFNQNLADFQIAALKYDDLQKQLDVASESLKQLLTTRETLRIDGAKQEFPWQLIAPPELPRDKDGKPIKAKLTKKTLMLVGALGLALGIGVAILVEIINNVFHNPEDVEEETKLSVLAVIPFAKEVRIVRKKAKLLAPLETVVGLTQRASKYLVIGNGNKVQRYIHSPAVEAFRSLYTNIRLQSPDKPIQSLVISSATMGDGKSTIAINLAKTAAAIGQRVLLVDADLRRPKIHQKLDLPNLRGLSEIISADIGLNEVIQRSHSEENLFVLTAGATPPDPIKHLSSEKMRHLMEQFQAFFDLVIYDTPPLLGLADANLLAAYTDGLVLVVGLAKTDRFMVLKALDGLNIAGSTVLGIVANGVKGFKPKVYKAYQRV